MTDAAAPAAAGSPNETPSRLLKSALEEVMHSSQLHNRRLFPDDPPASPRRGRGPPVAQRPPRPQKAASSDAEGAVAAAVASLDGASTGQVMPISAQAEEVPAGAGSAGSEKTKKKKKKRAKQQNDAVADVAASADTQPVLQPAFLEEQMAVSFGIAAAQQTTTGSAAATPAPHLQGQLPRDPAESPVAAYQRSLQLQGEVEALRSELQKLRSESEACTAAKQMNGRLHADLEEQRRAAERLEADLQRAAAERKELLGRLDALSREASDASSASGKELKARDEQICALEKALDQQGAHHEQELRLCLAQLEEARAQAEASASDAEARTAALVELEQQHESQLDAVREVHRQQLAQLEAAATAQLAEEHSQQTKTEAMLTRQVEMLRGEIEALRSHHRAELDAILGDLEAARVVSAALEERCSELGSALERAFDEKQVLEQQLTDAQAEVLACGVQAEHLRNRLAGQLADAEQATRESEARCALLEDAVKLASAQTREAELATALARDDLANEKAQLRHALDGAIHEKAELEEQLKAALAAADAEAKALPADHKAAQTDAAVDTSTAVQSSAGEGSFGMLFFLAAMVLLLCLAFLFVYNCADPGTCQSSGPCGWIKTGFMRLQDAWADCGRAPIY